MLDRRVLRAGVELGDPDQRGGQHQAHGAGAEQAHLAAGGGDGVVGHDHGGHEVERDQRQHAGNRQALVQRGHHVLHARAGLDEEAAHDGGDDGHAAEHQRVQHGLHGRGGDHEGAEHHGGDQRDRVGLEQVGGHAGAVAHVVAHVVGDHGRVARVVFRNAGLDLAHQVGAHVGALGEDAATQARKDRDQRGAEGKADQRVEQLGQVLVGREVAVADQEPEEAGHAQQAQADHQHAGDGAAAKSHVECRADALGGGLRGAHVGAHRDVHADEAAGAREHGAEHEPDGALAVEEDTDQDGEHHAHDRDRLVLPGEVGRRAGLNRPGDFLHAGIARVLGKNPAARPEAVGHGHKPTDQHEYQR